LFDDSRKEGRVVMQSIFHSIPMIDLQDGVIHESEHYGAGNYVVRIDKTTKQEYQGYLKKLEESGFLKYVDYESGINDDVFTAIYTYGELVLHVTYMSRLQRTYMSASVGLPLSEHLLYKEEYRQNCLTNTKTTLHMLEMWYFGNSFVIQLKNGHFIVSDGGTIHEAKYLLDYIRKLTPQGEKPTIEAWFITHAHGDHCGFFDEFITDKKLQDEFCVDGIYFNEPNDGVLSMSPFTWWGVGGIKIAAKHMRNSEGKRPKIYRPKTGERYYFCDVVIDIVHTQEQLPREEYRNEDYPGDFNDSSTWYMVHIDGQKVLFTGDGDVGSMDVIMKAYDDKYFDMDVLTLPHHGFNTSFDFVNFVKVRTVLATVRDKLPRMRKEQNAYFMKNVEEWLSWGDGTKVLEFPYKVGQYRSLPNMDWIYHEGQERQEQPNLE